MNSLLKKAIGNTWKYLILLILTYMIIAVWSCSPKASPASWEAAKPIEPVAVPVAKTDWQIEWERILQAAMREGRVAVYGPPIAEVRRSFIEAFQKAYPGITMEFTSITGAQATPKIKAERRANIYTVDVIIGGTTEMLLGLRDFLIPIKPHLILPEVKDPKDWMDGKLDFSDEAEEINLIFAIIAGSRILYNSTLVNPDEILSFWDFTKPKWRGKIVMYDPRAAGGGQAVAMFWYLNSQLGPDYLKAFADNKPVFLRDNRLVAETVGHGKYSIGVAPHAATTIELQKAGVPVKYAKVFKEGTYASAAFGSVSLFDKAPNSKAATVFLNWLLGKEGQKIWSMTSGYASRRLDAPTEQLPDEMKPPAPNIPLQYQEKEKYITKKDEIVDYLNKIFTGF